MRYANPFFVLYSIPSQCESQLGMGLRGSRITARNKHNNEYTQLNSWLSGRYSNLASLLSWCASKMALHFKVSSSSAKERCCSCRYGRLRRWALGLLRAQEAHKQGAWELFVVDLSHASPTHKHPHHRGRAPRGSSK
jgi:hypothetical protein